ncbi:MAG: hypothetical protein M3R63_00825 [Actinomycetota bacterium]|nr:hypothetical protein [Actinomycetota bacterium]
MSISLAIVEAAQEAARPARAVSDTAAVTAGVEAALAADRRCWGHRLVTRLDELPASATDRRELVAALAEEFFRTADEVDHGAGRAAGGGDQFHAWSARGADTAPAASRGLHACAG